MTVGRYAVRRATLCRLLGGECRLTPFLQWLIMPGSCSVKSDETSRAPASLANDGDLCYPGTMQTSCFMRSWFARYAIVLLALALANGNAHAALHLTAAHTKPCPEEHTHHTGNPRPITSISTTTD